MEIPSIKLSKEKKKISNLSAYAVASDGHHDVAEQSQVSVIDVKFVKLEDDVHYLLERLWRRPVAKPALITPKGKIGTAANFDVGVARPA